MQVCLNIKCTLCSMLSVDFGDDSQPDLTFLEDASMKKS